MTDKTNEQHSRQNDTGRGRLQHTLYQYKTILVALVFFIIGIAFIAWGTTFDVDKGPMNEIRHHLLRDLGIAATISALLGCAYEYLLRREFVSDAQEALGRAVNTERENLSARYVQDAQTSLRHVLEEQEDRSNKLDRLRAAGVQGVHDELDRRLLEQHFSTVIQRAQSNQGSSTSPRIRILETFTGRSLAGIMRQIKDAASAGCRVKILFLDPRSPQVAYRAKAMHRTTGEIKDNIKAELQELCQISSELEKDGKSSLEVKVYDEVPTNHVYDFDGIVLIGIYWRKIASFQGPQLEIDARDERSNASKLVQRINEQFDDLWERSTITPAEALKKLEVEERRQDQAHVVRVQLKAGYMDRRTETWRESLIPKLKKQKGFKEALVLGDDETNGMSITVWESEKDFQDSFSNPEIKDILEKAEKSVLAEPPEQSTYEVLLREPKRFLGPM
jgi:heme-degrading monooxygenase HmoA